jgi:hypothetical protein
LISNIKNLDLSIEQFTEDQGQDQSSHPSLKSTNLSQNEKKNSQSRLRTTQLQFQSLQGASRFGDALQSEKIIHEIKRTLEVLLAKKDQLTLNDLEKLKSIQLQAVKCLWELRSSSKKLDLQKETFEGVEQEKEFETIYFKLLNWIAHLS